MEQNLKERIEPQLLLIMDAKLEKAERRLGIDKLDIPPEKLKKIRDELREELAKSYQDGMNDHRQMVIDMYENDPDELVDLLERELDCV